jgi:hypothetical protein
MNVHKKIVALGVSAASVAVLTFGTLTGASAAPAPSTLVSGICSNLATTLTGLQDLLGTPADDAVAAAKADLDAKQAAVVPAVDGLAAAIVGYVKAVDTGVGLNTAVAVLNAANAVFSDKIVAENNAMTAWFEAQRTNYGNALHAGYIADVKSGLCV